ncbi:MAG: hypothetical protein LC753_05700 [Acidobacteria bacterium]|nr:hypothetical protein [Acidobacteriota bacterium]
MDTAVLVGTVTALGADSADTSTGLAGEEIMTADPTPEVPIVWFASTVPGRSGVGVSPAASTARRGVSTGGRLGSPRFAGTLPFAK